MDVSSFNVRIYVFNVKLLNFTIMRKLLMALFLLGTISVFCNAQIDGYYVKDGFSLGLFADGEPKTSTGISVEAGKSVEICFTQPSTGDFSWQKISGSGYIQLNPGGSGRFVLIGTQGTSRGDSAVFCVTDKNGDVLTITIYAY